MQLDLVGVDDVDVGMVRGQGADGSAAAFGGVELIRQLGA